MIATPSESGFIRREISLHFGNNDSVDQVIEQLREAGDGLADTHIEVEVDPCPYGGFATHRIWVEGRVAP